MTVNYTGAACEGELTVDAVRKGGNDTITNAEGAELAFGTATLRQIKS